MAWPFKDDESTPPSKPPETQPEVKTPDQLIAEGITNGLKPFAERFDKFEQRFSELENKAVVKPEPKPQTPPPAAISVLDDEDSAFNQRMAPLAIETLNTRFELMFDRAAREYSERIGVEAWKAIEPDVRRTLESETNPMLRANPAYIRNTIRMVMGEKAESGFRFDSQAGRFFLEDAASAVPGTKPTTPADGLSAVQIRAAKSFGMTPEQYKDALGKLEVFKD